MSAIYAFGILILIAFLGSRFFLKGKKPFSPLNYFFQSGLIYIFLGLYLGRHGLNILSPNILQNLYPIIGLGMGWIGFMFGFQLEYKYLKRFPKKYISLSYFQSFLVFLFVTVILSYVLRILFPDSSTFLLYAMAIAFGLLACIHSPTLLHALSSQIPKGDHYYYLARFLVSIGGFWGILGLALVVSFWHYPFIETGVLQNGLILLCVSTLIPMLLGYLFHRLAAQRISEQDLLVYLLGLVFFVSGAAIYFNLLPLYVCMVMGITFSNLTRRHEKIYPVLLSTEKPLYIVLLILIGALWEFNLDYRIFVLMLLFLALQIVAHTLSIPLLGRLLRFPFRLPPALGLSLLSYGGLGVAFAVSIKLAYPIELADVFLSTALLAIILDELLSPWLIKLTWFNIGLKK